MELVKEFGINPLLLGAQVVNFLIILFILKRYAYKPVMQLLKNRESSIKEGLEKAEEATRRLERALEKEKEMLHKAQKQTSEMMDQAKTQAKEMIHEAEQKARERTEKMIQEAQLQIQQEAQKTQKVLSQYVSKLAVEFLQKSVEDLFSDKNQDEVISKAVRELKRKTN